MSSVFEKFKKSIDKGVATVSVKSNTMLEINKINVYMDSLIEKIASKKAELGDKIYNLYVEEASYSEVIERICQEIIELDQQLLQKQEEIVALKEAEEEILGNQVQNNVCACGSEITQGNAFCTACGKKV